VVGPASADDAVAAALAWAWAHWDRLQSMRNPVGYLYVLARNEAFRERRAPLLPPPPPDRLPEVEPGLAPALASLSEKQRLCVLLVHGYEWRVSEVAELLGCSEASVQTHRRRGLARLRTELKVESDDDA
jgi:DNA-directed RNA polymerase specialized sigma24 family protein